MMNECAAILRMRPCTPDNEITSAAVQWQRLVHVPSVSYWRTAHVGSKSQKPTFIVFSNSNTRPSAGICEIRDTLPHLVGTDIPLGIACSSLCS